MTNSAQFCRDYDKPETRRKLRALVMLVKASYAKYGNRAEKPKILDIGCANDYFLGCLDAFGFDTFGIDISPYMIEQTKKFTRADALDRVGRMLKPGGLLFLTTGNPNSIVRFLMGRKWIGAAASDHVLLYTPYTLMFALLKQGFLCREIKTPQIYPFFTHLTLPLPLLKGVLNIPFGANIWVVAQKI